MDAPLSSLSLPRHLPSAIFPTKQPHTFFSYTKLALGECADRVAVRALADVSKGAGFAIAEGLQFINQRFGGNKKKSYRPE